MPSSGGVARGGGGGGRLCHFWTVRFGTVTPRVWQALRDRSRQLCARLIFNVKNFSANLLLNYKLALERRPALQLPSCPSLDVVAKMLHIVFAICQTVETNNSDKYYFWYCIICGITFRAHIKCMCVLNAKIIWGLCVSVKRSLYAVMREIRLGNCLLHCSTNQETAWSAYAHIRTHLHTHTHIYSYTRTHTHTHCRAHIQTHTQTHNCLARADLYPPPHPLPHYPSLYHCRGCV